MSKKLNKIVGNIGEDFACNYLIKNNYQIIERNYQSKRGEIDIIALENEELVFIEVKTRTQSYCGEPQEAVNHSKRKQLYKVAEYYLYCHNLLDTKLRFDIISINVYGSNSYHLHHIKDAIYDSPFH